MTAAKGSPCLFVVEHCTRVLIHRKPLVWAYVYLSSPTWGYPYSPESPARFCIIAFEMTTVCGSVYVVLPIYC